MRYRRRKYSACSEPKPCKLGDSTPGGEKAYLAAGFDLATWTQKGRPKRGGGGELFTNLIDGNGRVSERKELVHAGNDDSPDKTDNPSTKGRRRHLRIICVGNRRTDFWIWGVILKRSSRWVKIWIIIVIDSNVLDVPEQVCQLPSLQSGWKEIIKKSTDQGITWTIRGMGINLRDPVLFIYQWEGVIHR